MTETTPPPPGFTAGRDGLQAGESARARVVSLIEVRAGDMTLVADHDSHSIENTGDVPLVLIALILFTGNRG